MLDIHPIPAFHDNYFWILHHHNSNNAYVIDPGDEQPVIEGLKQLQLSLAGILVTHHHGDHTGGIGALQQQFGVPVYGPESANIPAITHPQNDGDLLILDEGRVQLQIFEIPGHTLDHIAYYSADESSLFCGDTLFAGGCGRVFEGTPKQMFQSLQKLAQLPPQTQVFCAHEYTMTNLTFAEAIEPGNAALQRRAAKVREQRQNHAITLPSTIELELATNPFLRTSSPEIKKSASTHAGRPLTEPWEIFANIRTMKDNF